MKVREILNAVIANNMSASDAESLLTDKIQATEHPQRTAIAISVPLGLALFLLLGGLVHSCQTSAQAERDYWLKTQACRTEGVAAAKLAYEEGRAKCVKTLVDLVQNHQFSDREP